MSNVQAEFDTRDAATQQRELTFGEKLCGVDFNPAGHEKVKRLKALAAEMADIVFEEYKVSGNGKPVDGGRLRDILAEGAFQSILNGQMNAVKFVTNRH
jgi:hypothetical protein